MLKVTLSLVISFAKSKCFGFLFSSTLSIPHCVAIITVCIRMWLDAVDDVRVSHEHVHHPAAPLVPHKDTPTVTPTQHPVLAPKVGLLDLCIQKMCMCIEAHVCRCIVHD